MKKKLKQKRKYLIVVVFILVVLYPYIAHIFGFDSEIKGVEQKIELSLDTIDDYILQNFPGRSTLIKVKNQLLYSIFGISNNESVVKVDGNLIATESLNYFHGANSISDEKMDELINKLERLNEIVNKKNKKMLVILTPTKVRFYNGKIPFADRLIDKYDAHDYKLPYEQFKEKTKGSTLNIFDSIEYINNNKDIYLGGEVPLYYKSGHHWSNYKSNLLGTELLKYVTREFGIRVPSIDIEYEESDDPQYPDADLHEVLNVYSKPKEKFFVPSLKYNDTTIDERNYTLSGGSFMSGLLLPNMTAGLSNEVYEVMNKYFFYHHFADNVTFETYDEINEKFNLIDHINKTDVFIFEIHELNFYNASFGFLDYILEHVEI